MVDYESTFLLYELLNFLKIPCKHWGESWIMVEFNWKQLGGSQSKLFVLKEFTTLKIILLYVFCNILLTLFSLQILRQIF